MPRAVGTPSSMAAGSLTRSGPGPSGRTSARRVQIVVHTAPIKLFGCPIWFKMGKCENTLVETVTRCANALSRMILQIAHIVFFYLALLFLFLILSHQRYVRREFSTSALQLPWSRRTKIPTLTITFFSRSHRVMLSAIEPTCGRVILGNSSCRMIPFGPVVIMATSGQVMRALWNRSRRPIA